MTEEGIKVSARPILVLTCFFLIPLAGQSDLSFLFIYFQVYFDNQKSNSMFYNSDTQLLNFVLHVQLRQCSLYLMLIVIPVATACILGVCSANTLRFPFNYMSRSCYNVLKHKPKCQQPRLDLFKFHFFRSPFTNLPPKNNLKISQAQLR